MESITMETLSLNTFDKDNKIYLDFLKKLLCDKTIKQRFQGFLPNLLRENTNSIIGRGFFVSCDNELIGYIDIGNYNINEKSVYLRCAIEKSKRKKAYGRRILSEISDYIFNTHPEVETIKLKIDKDNVPSLKVADACGYKWINDDYYGLSNPYTKSHTHKWPLERTYPHD